MLTISCPFVYILKIPIKSNQDNHIYFTIFLDGEQS